jgi:transglutaminase-like putative cysteine protease
MTLEQSPTASAHDGDWRLGVTAGLATFLTALCLTPTISDTNWLVDIVVVIAVITVTGIWLRRVSAPRPLIPIAQLLILALTLIEMPLRGATFYGLPTVGTVTRAVTLTNNALDAIWNKQPPVTSTDGLVLVVMAGVGLVAVAVDTLAATYHLPVAAGAPLFLLYVVPAAALPDGVPWPLFGLAAAGWLVLLLSAGRERLVHWGQVVGASGRPNTSASALTGTGRRLGATALVAAIAIPMVVPSIGDGVFGAGGVDKGATGPRQGNNDGPLPRVITLNPLVGLKRDLTQGANDPVFRYYSTDPTPQYWRVATLDEFDGFTWTLAESSAGPSQQANSGLPPAPGLTDDVPRSDVVTDVRIDTLNSKRLPLPYPATRVDILGDWRYDSSTFDVFSGDTGGNALGQDYVVHSLDVQPTTAELASAPAPSADMQHYLIVPPDVTDMLSKVTAQIVGSSSNELQKAQAIQNWFRNKFTYSLAQPAGNDTNDLASFLHDRSGYCEQFAATMALMARVAGIPSRVQVGFTPGIQQEDKTWQVSTHDAHAWPELWFEGVGWVRFEPTPGGGTGSGTPPWAPGAVVHTPKTHGGKSAQWNPGHSLRRGGASPATDLKARALAALKRGNSTGLSVPVLPPPAPDRRPFLLFALVLGLLAAIAPFVTKVVTRTRRWAGVSTEGEAVRAAWADVLETATDLDLAPQPTETPRDLAVRIPRASGLSTNAADDWAALCRAVELQRYGGDRAHADDAERMKAWRTRSRSVEAALNSVVRPADRRRARWWPASGRHQLAVRWAHALDALGTTWQNVLGRGLRLRQAVRPNRS